MPQYPLKCTVEECGHELVKICRYAEAKEMKCPECEAPMKIVPSVSMGVVNGFSEANGYQRENLNYDGSSRPW